MACSAIFTAFFTLFINLSPVPQPSFPALYSNRTQCRGKSGSSADMLTCFSSNNCGSPRCWSTKSLTITPEPLVFGWMMGVSSVAQVHGCPLLVLKILSPWYIRTSFFVGCHGYHIMNICGFMIPDFFKSLFKNPL